MLAREKYLISQYLKIRKALNRFRGGFQGSVYIQFDGIQTAPSGVNFVKRAVRQVSPKFILCIHNQKFQALKLPQHMKIGYIVTLHPQQAQIRQINQKGRGIISIT